jgi:hypothetical protein
MVSVTLFAVGVLRVSLWYSVAYLSNFVEKVLTASNAYYFDYFIVGYIPTLHFTKEKSTMVL